MTGEHQNSDDDFLDDFVLDEGLEAEAPAAPGAARPGSPARAGAPDRPVAAGFPGGGPAGDEDDLLFTDHTKGLVPTERFQSAPFDEAAGSAWSGESLELDEVGIPEDAEAGTPIEAGASASDPQADQVTFSDELGALIEDEKDFALADDGELEIVGGADGDATDMAGADVFVIEDAKEGAESAIGDDVVELDDEALPVLADEIVEGEQVGAAEGGGAVVDFFGNVGSPQGAPTTEEGWEPLPGTRIDDLAEVEGVELVDDVRADAGGDLGGDFDADGSVDDADSDYTEDPIYGEGTAASAEAETSEAEAQAFAPAGLAPVAAEVEGHDIYGEVAETPAPVVVGAFRRRGRVLSILSGLAAVLAILGIAGLAVSRPEWFGLRYEPTHVEIAEVARPRVQVDVPTPTMPAVADPVATGTAVTPPTDPVTPTEPQVTAPTPTSPGNEQPTETPTEKPAPTGSEPTAPTAPAPSQTNDPAVGSAPPAPVVTPSNEPPALAAPTESWPVAVAPAAPAPAEPSAPTLTRVDDHLLIGELVGEAARQGVEGVALGSRAFAQLGNGNYFIGNVKAADAQYLTLRVAEGEVSLPRRQIVRLAQLGSSDYDELQKATSGFVRLTNSNRLVGAILSSIADDHVVLETRSNRVMLPKSAIEEIVKTEAENGVRITTTKEEDEWLRQKARQQLQKREPAASPTPSPGGGRGN